MRKGDLPVKPIMPDRSKKSRAHAAEVPFEQGCVWHMDRDWVRPGFPQISYQYSIQGRTMLNTHLRHGPEISWRDRSETNHFLERYIARSRVLVYYNPNDVADAVLEPSSGGLEPATWAGIVMVLLGLGVVLIYDRLS